MSDRDYTVGSQQDSEALTMRCTGRREFYIKITKKFGWTKDVLINQLEAGAFERYMANQTNFDKVVPEKYRHQAKLGVA